MAIVCLPVGFLYAGFYGLLAAIVAVIVERFEIGPVDDNILIAFTSTAILAYPYIGYIIS
jgi:dolichol kinase